MTKGFQPVPRDSTTLLQSSSWMLACGASLGWGHDKALRNMSSGQNSWMMKVFLSCQFWGRSMGVGWWR